MTNMMLGPPPGHLMVLFAAATEHQQVADRFTYAFDIPSDFWNWCIDPEAAHGYLEQVTAASG